MNNSRRSLKADSDCTRILAHLVSGRTLTSWQAICKWQCTRLAARVADLRRRGHDIRSEMVRVNGTRIARYRLAKPRSRRL